MLLFTSCANPAPQTAFVKIRQNAELASVKPVCVSLDFVCQPQCWMDLCVLRECGFWLDAHPHSLIFTPMSQPLPPTIDPAAAARWQRAAPALSPWLHEEVAQRMEQRLQWMTLQPHAWAHWEALRGGLQAQALLARRFPKALCYVVEPDPGRAAMAVQSLAVPWWRLARWRGPVLRHGVPPDGGVQMLWANMALHMAGDPQALIAQWQRALAVGGYVMFSCLGPDTARGLHALYAELGWPAAGQSFTDMHDWGDMLVQAGFAEPVMDMERITLSFDSPQRLLQELRELGCNLHPQRFAGLRGRGWRHQLEQALAQRLQSAAEAGRLPLTFEVIYGHAFKAAPRPRLAPQTVVTLQDMRGMLQAQQP